MTEVHVTLNSTTREVQEVAGWWCSDLRPTLFYSYLTDEGWMYTEKWVAQRMSYRECFYYMKLTAR